MKSTMQHQFSQIPDVQLQRSKFNRSHGYKTTFNSGYLIPVFVDEALPGDTFNVRMTSFARLATPLHPIMDNLHLDTFFFAVPNRLVWNNWQKFCGERINPDDDIDYVLPYMDAPAVTGHAVGTLSDYFGIPTGIAALRHHSLFHRAYNLIYNEWFRPQDIIDSVVVDKDDGPDNPADYVLLRRAKRHDYFTSCLPWPQKGDAVLLPLGDTAPVTGLDSDITWHTTADPVARALQLNSDNHVVTETSTSARNKARWTETALIADLSTATAATINELRQAFQIQRMLERDARAGTRYIELLRSHFGVVSPDARLQRPEYLGGGSSPITVNPIPQTSSAVSGSPQGNLAAMGYGSAQHGFTKSFTEHCLLIGLVNVRADLTYQQGLNRMFSRSTRYDFYWPSLANLGEQTVLNKEIYAKGDANDDLVFGYQERYAEYRYKPSTITGKFRSTDATSLDVWHLAQEFSNLPQLGKTFIEENPPIARIVAVQNEPEFLFDSFFDMNCVRPMPVYSVPGLIDHF